VNVPKESRRSDEAPGAVLVRVPYLKGYEMATHEVLVDTRQRETQTWLSVSPLAGRRGYVPGAQCMEHGTETDCHDWIQRRLNAYNAVGGTAYWFDAAAAVMVSPSSESVKRAVGVPDDVGCEGMTAAQGRAIAHAIVMTSRRAPDNLLDL